MSLVLDPPIRQEYEVTPAVAARRTVTSATPSAPLVSRLRDHAWLRKALILAALAVLWEAIARWQHNDLLLPSFLQTASAFFDGIASGELLDRIRTSDRKSVV